MRETSQFRSLLMLPLLLLMAIVAKSQPGTWTWMKGPNLPNAPGNFGTQGVAAASNEPPTMYECAGWTDPTGNFWLFAGLDGNFQNYGDMWRYDPTTNIWTWMKGAGAVGLAGIYGVQGVSSPTNLPGGRGWGCARWIDTNGDLWVFGGLGYDINGVFGELGDLWKYNIASNEWTWMKGPDQVGISGNYGLLGIPAASNLPQGRHESNATWVDGNGDLWMFGGYDSNGAYSDVWRYNIATNIWTWMAGSNVVNEPANHGIQGVTAASNTPGGRACYTGGWKDCHGNFWIFGGTDFGGAIWADMWTFDPTILQWTWVAGSAFQSSTGAYINTCNQAGGMEPLARFENRAAWTDLNGRFWNFGGFIASTSQSTNDLWCYEPNNNRFTWVSGVNLPNQLAVFGTQGVASPANVPGSRGGSTAFSDLQGNLWLFGGWDFSTGLFYGDLWRYIIDPQCPVPVGGSGIVVAAFSAQPTTGCAPLLVTFTNASTGGVNYHWDFGDGGTATTANPSHTYLAAGTYTVSLIVDPAGCAAVSSDTTTTTIAVSPGFNVSLGPDQSICPSDVTVLTPSPAGQSYLWSNNATSPSITVGQSGSYWVQVTNATGCIARDTVTINVINPQLNLGADQTVCAGDTVVLDAGYPGASYLWSNNYNTQTVAVTATADYWVQVTLPLGCILRDTMRATFVPLPFLNIGSDAAICAGESVVLDAGPHPNDALLWSTNATTQLITTSTPGLYWAEVTANPGCTTRDTVLVNLDPTPVVEIGGDTVICQGDSLLLDAGNAGSIFDWNTGVHTQAITVSDAGSYGVTVTNAQGCSATDVRTVTTIQDFAIELGPDTFLCDVNALLLDPGVADLVYQWSTSANTHLITATASGMYWVDVSNACFAHSDSIRLTFSSDSAGPFIPSAFTPNGDGLNDVLRIEGLRVDVGFQMRIFDRWGMMVYESTDPMAGWDGKLHGVAAQEGVYALLVQVTDCRGKLQPVVGSVSLMR